MKPKSITPGRSVSAFAVIAGTMVLLSWNHQPVASRQTENTRSSTLSLERLMVGFTGDHTGDTTPIRNKKPRDIDEAIEELDRIDLQVEIDEAMKSVKVAMDQIDEKKLHAEIDKAMKSVDMDQVKKQVNESMSKIDWDAIKQTVNESMAKIDWKQIEASMDEVKKINWDEIRTEIKKAQLEIEKKGPEIKLEMEKAKVEIEKAKVELKSYKGFIDGLEKDGLISKKEGYTLDHKDGELKINGKKASDDTHKKYRSFLEKHESFHIQIKDGEFNLNDGSWNSDDDDEDAVVS